MHQLKCSCRYPEKQETTAEPISARVDSKSTHRIIKRELLQTHRAQPFLVESLLLSIEVGIRTHSTAAPSMECILQILQFSKKMKWLCEWGPEIVDESLRPPSASLPDLISEKSTAHDPSRSNSLMHEDIVAFLRDPSQHWDRIMLRWYDPEYLEYLHLHPCQELYMEFEEIQLTLKVLRNARISTYSTWD